MTTARLLSHILSISPLYVWKQYFTHTFILNHYFEQSPFFFFSLETWSLILIFLLLVLHCCYPYTEKFSLTAMKNISETRSWCNWHYVRILITQNIWELFQLFSFIYRVILLHNTCMCPRNTPQKKIWRSSPINGSFDRKGNRKVVDLLYTPQQ